jgi:Protein of unknown function (DUF3168)
MTAPAAELQKAIFAELGGDAALLAVLGGARIYAQAQVQAGVPHPYVGFGLTGVYDWVTSTEKDTEQLFTLHIWSKAKGEAETVTIMDLTRARLADKVLALDDRQSVELKLEFAEARYDEDLAVHHGLLRYRAVATA